MPNRSMCFSAFVLEMRRPCSAAHCGDWLRRIAKAREMVEQMRRRGDHDGADTWVRIIVAITELGDAPTEARH